MGRAQRPLQLAAGVLPVTDDRPARLEGGRIDTLGSGRVFGPWMNVRRAREAFRRWVADTRMWPESMMPATLAAFDRQRMHNEISLGEYGGPGPWPSVGLSLIHI